MPESNEDKVSLKLIPISIKAAAHFVRIYHRHHGKPPGALFAVACCTTISEKVIGVAIIGRPVARRLDDGYTAEVTRLATDGTPNACSMLYGAARRAAAALGYKHCLTYTLASESGASLRGAGWTPTVMTKGGSWSRPGRGRTDKAPITPKQRWEVAL